MPLLPARALSSSPPCGGRWVSRWQSPISSSSRDAMREKSASSGTPKVFTSDVSLDATTLIAFDHLGDQDMAPRTQPGPSALARRHGVTKGLANRPDVGHQAIGTDQQGMTCRTAPHALDQPSDQGQVTLLTDFAAQPQARLDHHGQRHPHDAALFLDAELIGLHLSQVAWLLDKILVHGLALTTRAGPPIRDGTLVEPKRRHDGLHGTPMGEQGHHEHHGLCRGT